MIGVFSGVLADPRAYRAAALRAAFGSVETPAGTFHGIAAPPSDAFVTWLQGQGLTVTGSALRRSPLGQVEPNYVHTDTDMGDWMAVLYLTPEPPAEDGTRFWAHGTERTGAAGHYSADPERDGFQPWNTVAAAFNHAVVFPAAYFHARAMFENYGLGDDARLIQIAFATGHPKGESWQ